MTNIAAIPQRADPEIVAAFERLLEMARRGEIVGFVVTYELTGHQIGSESNFRDGVVMLGHLTRQMHMANLGLDGSSWPE